MEVDKFKLLLKKAVFAGNTFLRHTDDIQDLIDGVQDESLIELFENDEEAFKLLNKWEEIRSRLSEMGAED